MKYPVDLGIVLNTRLSAEDNVVSTANKALRVVFYLIRPFATLTPTIFLPGRNLNILFKHPLGGGVPKE